MGLEKRFKSYIATNKMAAKVMLCGLLAIYPLFDKCIEKFKHSALHASVIHSKYVALEKEKHGER